MKDKLNEESINPLSEIEYHQKAEPQLRKIFLNDNYQLPSFGLNAEAKKVLYEYWTPDEQVMNAIARAAPNLGDTGFYISIINKRMPGTSSDIPEHWWVPFSELSTYLSVNTDIFHFAYQLENVIYSPQGKWGLMYTFDKYGILGGVESFMEEFCQSFPSIDQQILNFLNHARECINEYGLGQVNIGWLGGFLKQVYGSEQAKIMVQESQLSNYINIE
ncbi:MAG: hypothetical protein SVX43_11960 [Cyanobacteriota bacterium]|nr:hypothetical protein [Cyanobacteriota bacterium]